MTAHRERISKLGGSIGIVFSLMMDFGIFITSLALGFFLTPAASLAFGTVTHWIILIPLTVYYVFFCDVGLTERLSGKALMGILGSVTPFSITMYTGYTVGATWYDDWKYNKEREKQDTQKPFGRMPRLVNISNERLRRDAQWDGFNSKPRNPQPGAAGRIQG